MREEKPNIVLANQWKNKPSDPHWPQLATLNTPTHPATHLIHPCTHPPAAAKSSSHLLCKDDDKDDNKKSRKNNNKIASQSCNKLLQAATTSGTTSHETSRHPQQQPATKFTAFFSSRGWRPLVAPADSQWIL